MVEGSTTAVVGTPQGGALLLLVRSPAAVLAAHAVKGEDVFVDCGPELGWEAGEERGGGGGGGGGGGL